MTKPTSTQSDQSSLCAQWVAKDSIFLHADSEDSDRNGRMLGADTSLLVLSRCGSNRNQRLHEKT